MAIAPNKRPTPCSGARCIRRRDSEHGFALIIAMSLMGLILALLLALSTTTKVQMATVNNERNAIQAELNAFLGLQIAAGQLQEQMGPDQRVSARGSMLKSSSDASTSSLGPNDPRRFWTGVWDADFPRTSDPADAEWNQKMTWMRTPNQRHRGWLVSGIEENNGAVPTINTNLGSDYSPVDDSIALLAGQGSLGVLQTDQFAMAPKVDLSASTSSGAFAYWVSDEAQKAPLGIVDSRYTGSTPSSVQERFDLMAPERVGINALDDWDGYDVTDTSFAEDLQNLITYSGSTHLRNSGLPNDNNGWETLLQENFHNVGMGGINLQTDVRYGGLKKDLSLLFELSDADFNSTPYAGATSTRNDAPPTDGTDYIDAYTRTPVSYLFKHPANDIADNAFIRGPTWHYLRNFYREYKNVQSVATDPVINARAYRPNTIDFNEVNGTGKDGRISGLLNIMNYQYNGNIEDGNNFVNTRADPPEWKNGTIDVPRLTSHEFAPVALRLFLVFGFADVTPSTGITRIARDPSTGLGDKDKGNSNKWGLVPSGVGSINALVIQPIAVLWNPYNTKISFKAFKIAFEQPSIAFKFSWNESVGSRSSLDYRASLGQLIGASVPERDQHGQIYNNNYMFLEFLIGNPPDGGEPIVLNPGELKIFSPSTKHQIGNIINQGDAMFLEEGWHENGGLLLYRTSKTPAKYKRQNSSESAPKYAEIDNIPSSYPVTIDDIYWIAANGVRHGNGNKEIRLNSSTKSNGIAEYLLTDTDSIKEGGNRQSDDFELRSIGASYSNSSGIQQAFQGGIIGQTISSSDITASGGIYPFMAMEVRLSTAQGSDSEMLGNTNPFGVLGAGFHGGGYTPDRYQMSISPMRGKASYNSIRPETALGGSENVYFGYNYSASSGSTHVVMEEAPTTPLWSLGSLQHANISLSAYQPRNAIGNAQATPYINSNDLDLQEQLGSGSMKPSLADISYLSNETLFDSYFFSSLAPQLNESDVGKRIDNMIQEAQSSGSDPLLPNSRFAYFGSSDYPGLKNNLDDPEGYRKTAAYWAPRGGFNVNSTSKEAWKAFLGSHLNRQYQYFDGSLIQKSVSTGSLLSRFSLPSTTEGDPTDPRDDWSAPFNLSDQQLDDLAQEIVDEVNERGPFLSFADFVNRRPGSDDLEQQAQGTIARAIDQANLNTNVASHGSTAYDGSNVSSDFIATNTSENTAAGIPGWLTQADVLTSLAPYASVRGDTFVVRSYGEAEESGVNGQTSQAWCEATFQRIPEFTDSTVDQPWTHPTTAALNKTFGRRFVLIDFKWLTKDEI